MCSPPPLPKQLDLSTCLGKVCFLHLLLHDTSDQRLLQGNTENSGFSITSSWSTAAELLQGEPSTTVKHCIIPSLCCLDLLWESVGGALHCSLTVIMETSVFITLPINLSDLCLDQNMYYVYKLLPLMLLEDDFTTTVPCRFPDVLLSSQLPVTAARAQRTSCDCPKNSKG